MQPWHSALTSDATVRDAGQASSSMPASRFVVSVLLRKLGETFLYTPQGRPCGRPSAALGPATTRRLSAADLTLTLASVD
jgi:hypothetical protein